MFWIVVDRAWLHILYLIHGSTHEPNSLIWTSQSPPSAWLFTRGNIILSRSYQILQISNTILDTYSHWLVPPPGHVFPSEPHFFFFSLPSFASSTSILATVQQLSFNWLLNCCHCPSAVPLNRPKPCLGCGDSLSYFSFNFPSHRISSLLQPLSSLHILNFTFLFPRLSSLLELSSPFILI